MTTVQPGTAGGLADEVDHMRQAREPGIPVPQDLPAGFDQVGIAGLAHMDVRPGHTAPTLTVFPVGRGRRAPRSVPLTAEARAAQAAEALTVPCPVPACRAGVGCRCRNTGPHQTRIILAGRTPTNTAGATS